MIQQVISLFSYLNSLRGEMKKSRFKIWLRAFLFLQFSAMFSFYFFRDIGNGYFSWKWAALLFTLFIPVGFLMSLIVPMKVDLEIQSVTLFDLVVGHRQTHYRTHPSIHPRSRFHHVRHYGNYVRAAGRYWTACAPSQSSARLYFEITNIMVTL